MCDNNCEVCDVCGKEFDEGEELFECEEELCPFNFGSVDPFAPLDFSKDYNTSQYVPEYIPEYDPLKEDKEDTEEQSSLD